MASSPKADSQGLFVVLEGTDGTGKTTQLKLLSERLKAVGYEVSVFDFPRYQEPSSHFIKQYLNGAYGPANKINPFTASLFYALDRFEAAPAIRKDLASGKIVLSDRYAASNMGHQGSKFQNLEQQRGFFVWEDNLEFELLGIPRPDLNLILQLPIDTTLKLMNRRSSRAYTDRKLDEHEADAGHLTAANSAYENLLNLFPKDFVAIDCSHGGKLLPVPEINDKIWSVLKNRLPKNKPHKPKPLTVNLSADVSKPKIASQEDLKEADTANLVLDKLSLLSVSKLYEADRLNISVRSHWGATKPGYDFFSLRGVEPGLKNEYQQYMKHVVELHKRVTSEVNQYLHILPPQKKQQFQAEAKLAVEAITPLAALADVDIDFRTASTRDLMFRLEQSDIEELNWLAKQIETSYDSKRSGKPSDSLDRRRLKTPEKLSRTIERLSRTKLAGAGSFFDEPVKLIAHRPNNEFDLLADGIYPFTSLSQPEIKTQLETWLYEQKTAALQSMVRQSDFQLLKNTSYRFDVVLSRNLLNLLLKSGRLEDFSAQSPTPRFGYEVPKLIEDAKVEETFMEIFDASLEIFSRFQSAGHENLGAYVTLMGHKTRCQFSLNGLSIRNVIIPNLSYQHGLRLFAEELMDQVKLVHPELANHAYSSRPPSREAQPKVGAHYGASKNQPRL